VVHVWRRRNEYRVLAGKPEAKDHLEDLGVDGKMTLNWILRKEYRRL